MIFIEFIYNCQARVEVPSPKSENLIPNKLDIYNSIWVVQSRDVILGHLEVEFTSGGTTIPLNLIETEQELKGSLK